MSNCDRRLSDAAQEAARQETDKLSGGGVETELPTGINFLHSDAEAHSEYALDNATTNTAALSFGAGKQGKYFNWVDKFVTDFSPSDDFRSQTMSEDLPSNRKDTILMQQSLIPLTELGPTITGNMSPQTLLPADAPSPHEVHVQSMNAEPQALRQPSYSPAGAQTVALYRDAEVSIFMTVVPSLNYTYEACMNRIRKLRYDPLVRLSHEKQRQEHIVTMRQLQLQLDVAVSNYLESTLQLSQPTTRQLLRFYVALYHRVILELVNVAKLRNKNPNLPQDPFQLRDHQVRCLLRALNEMNARLRDVKESERGTFFACAESTAWAWQVDIHRFWIEHFTDQKKHKEEPNEEALELPHARERIKSDLDHPSNAVNVTKRRPGRPPGALNKSTIAAREKKAAAARVRSPRASSTALPTPSPRASTRLPQPQYTSTPLRQAGRCNAIAPVMQPTYSVQKPASNDMRQLMFTPSKQQCSSNARSTHTPLQQQIPVSNLYQLQIPRPARFYTPADPSSLHRFQDRSHSPQAFADGHNPMPSIANINPRNTYFLNVSTNQLEQQPRENAHDWMGYTAHQHRREDQILMEVDDMEWESYHGAP